MPIAISATRSSARAAAPATPRRAHGPSREARERIHRGLQPRLHTARARCARPATSAGDAETCVTRCGAQVRPVRERDRDDERRGVGKPKMRVARSSSRSCSTQVCALLRLAERHAQARSAAGSDDQVAPRRRANSGSVATSSRSALRMLSAVAPACSLREQRRRGTAASRTKTCDFLLPELGDALDMSSSQSRSRARRSPAGQDLRPILLDVAACRPIAAGVALMRSTTAGGALAARACSKRRVPAVGQRCELGICFSCSFAYQVSVWPQPERACRARSASW